MKKHFLMVALAGLVSLSLVGCDSPQAGGQQGTTQANGQKEAAQASTATVAKTAQATLTVTPGAVSGCTKDAHINPEITWQRIDPSVKNTRVTVTSPGSSDEKLFATGGFGGAAKAGDWVVPGVTFHLYDADTGDALTSYTVTVLPCTQ